MLSEDGCRTYTEILKNELIEATGCTEPIALALAGAKARAYLGKEVEKVEVYCSGNMIKNVKAVVVPNSGEMKGIEAAVLLGIIGGDAEADLQVISKVNQAQREKLKETLEKNIVRVYLATNVPNLYIRVKVYGQGSECEVVISDTHTNVSKIVKDGSIILEKVSEKKVSPDGPDKSLLNVRDILEYGETVDIEAIREVIQRQIDDNTAISDEGLNNVYGAQVGRNLLKKSNDIYTRARAAAAAGSDARMNGCPMAVVINSGSGNQGMTVSLPVIEFAREMNVSEEKLIRALAISNLVAIHQKKYIGALSAYCGAVSAATGAASAICWLKGGSYEEICATISNSIVTINGMVCDGAKSSCAGKIALALDASLMAMDMAMNDSSYQPQEGLVKDNVEETIAAVGKMAKDGMKETDVEILNIMLGNEDAQ